ncbi:MAG: PilZ domain-containing protein [Acidobacteria bacterium]|nr:PilZ domain-containing protein [Acidobacteriota bacterium]
MSVISPEAVIRKPVEDIKRDHPGAATGDLDELRHALTARLSALEAALADPGQSAVLERLTIDLARVATAEAEASAAQAWADAAAKVRDHAVTLRETAAALDAERASTAALQRDLGRLRTAYEAECGTVAQLRRDLAAAHTASKGERDAAAQAAATIARLRQDLDGVQRAAKVRIAELEGASARSTAESNRHVAEMDALKAELEASREATAAAEVDARARYDARLDSDRAQFAERLADARAHIEERLEEARTQLDGRVANAQAPLNGRICDLELELAAVQSAATARIADVEKSADGFRIAADRLRDDVDRARGDADRVKSDADRVKEVAHRLTEELEAARSSARAAEAEAEARYEHAREQADRRILDLELEIDERNREIRKRDAAYVVDPGPEAKPVFTTDQEPEPPVDYQPARRAKRVAFEDVEVLIDEDTVVLVNLSTGGAQVLSPRALRPNRVLTVQLAGGERPVSCASAVVWARLEPTHGSLMYRAGMAFLEVDERAVEEFLTRYESGIRN